MDNKLITTIILTIIGSGIIAPFSKSIFDKIFSAYNPDPKKINSGIKKILLFTIRYILPISNLVYVYTTHKVVDKYLVFLTAFIFSALILNIILDLFYHFIDKIIGGLINVSKLHNDSHSKTIVIINKIVTVLDKLTNQTPGLIDKNKTDDEKNSHQH